MSTQTLASVASQVVDQYSQVGKLAIGAYRTGAQRLATGASARYASFLHSKALPLVSDDAKAGLIGVQQRIAGFVDGGIALGTDRADKAIDLISGGVHAGIDRMVSSAERVEAAFDTQVLTKVGSLAMPLAQVTLQIANRAAEGAKALSERLAGAEVEVEVRRTAAPAKRAAKKVVRRAKARAR